jgi:putative membrane protein
MPVIAVGAAIVAGLVHVYTFVLESLWFDRPAVWRRFGIASEADVRVVRSFAFNQGFYNLFLAIGAVLGLVLYWAGADDTTLRVAGFTLVLFSLGSMLAASLVLLTSGGKYLRPALIQGTLPLIGFVLFLFA